MILLPPIVERELRGALWKKEPRKNRMRITWIGIGVSAIFILASSFSNSPGVAHLSQEVLLYVGLYFATLKTIQFSADMFTVERQNQTMGFLFLAGLTPMEIFSSKVLGSFVVSFCNLLALAPFLAVPFLTGGISFSLFWATVWCLPVLMIFSLALATLGSVLCEEESMAVGVAIALGSVLCIATPIMGWAMHMEGKTISANWLILSPAYGPWVIDQDGYLPDFWRNGEVTLAWAGAFFVLAAVVLRKTWRMEAGEGLLARWMTRYRGWLHGTPEWRRQQTHLLEDNPMAWLAVHDRGPERMAWVAIGGITMLWLICWWLVPVVWVSVPNFFLTAAVLHLVLTGIIYFTAAKRMADFRRQNISENVLSTPLSVAEIVEGQFQALGVQFGSVSRAVLALNILMLVGGLLTRHWNYRGLFVYFVIWTPLLFWRRIRSGKEVWTLMWAGFNLGRPMVAVWRTLKPGWWGFWMVFNGRSFFGHINRSFPSGSRVEFVVVFIITVFVSLVIVARKIFEADNPVKDRLLREFRSIAEEPIPEGNDPRFKKWNVMERLSKYGESLAQNRG